MKDHELTADRSAAGTGKDRRQERTEAIAKLLAEFAPSDHTDLLAQMMVTIWCM